MRSEQSVVLVAGSGRSGTSLFSGVLQRLGYHVPGPEVPPDETNPRGFAESQWVVDFHTRLLRRARVQVSDARPAAWGRAAAVGLEDEVAAELRAWLGRQLGDADDIVIKDPRLSWFLPLWRRCAEDAGAAVRCVTVLRHPAAVVDSKQRWYGGWQGEVGRAAGWVNLTLLTERATRGAERAFVHYDDLLDDWTQTVGRLADALGLSLVRHAPVSRLRDVHAFVDRGLSRSRPEWGDLRIPPALRALADLVWESMGRVAETGAADEALDSARAAYVELYEQAEAIAQSSIEDARRRPARPSHARTPAPRLLTAIPARYRHRVPLRWRARVLAMLPGR